MNTSSPISTFYATPRGPFIRTAKLKSEGGSPIYQFLPQCIPGKGKVEVEVENYSVTFKRAGTKTVIEDAPGKNRPNEVSYEGIFETYYGVHPEFLRHVGNTWGIWTPLQKTEAAARAIIAQHDGVSRSFISEKKVKTVPLWPWTHEECSFQAHALKHSD